MRYFHLCKHLAFSIVSQAFCNHLRKSRSICSICRVVLSNIWRIREVYFLSIHYERQVSRRSARLRLRNRSKLHRAFYSAWFKLCILPSFQRICKLRHFHRGNFGCNFQRPRSHISNNSRAFRLKRTLTFPHNYRTHGCFCRRNFAFSAYAIQCRKKFTFTYNRMFHLAFCRKFLHSLHSIIAKRLACGSIVCNYRMRRSCYFYKKMHTA